MENYPLLWRRTRPAKKTVGRPPRLSVDEVELRTDQPYAAALLAFFRKRERRLRR